MEHVTDDCTCEGKKCTRCDEVKCYGAFSFIKQINGLGSWCKRCRAEKSREYHALNKKKCNARSETYHQSHLDERKEYRKSYYQSHREHLRTDSAKKRDRAKESERVKQYYQSHVQETIDRQKAWRKKNVDRFKIRCSVYNYARRARKVQASGKLTTVQWLALKEQYNYTCLRCGRREPEIKLTADHIMPLALGGSNSIENIQPLCSSCNSSKGTKFIDFRPKTP